MRIKLLNQYLKQGLRVLLLVLSVLSNSLAFAYNFQVDDIYYNINGSEATVTYKSSNYNSYSGCVTIPCTVTFNGVTYAVTSIGDYAFYDCKSLTNITIPETITSIGKKAFCVCTGLTGVNITDLAAWCKINFIYDSDNKYFVFSNPLLYAHHLYLNGSEINNLVIPESVTSISQYAFEGCSALTSVSIPNSVTSIGTSAFYGCSNLPSVTIPSSVTSIGSYSFNGCTGLNSVTIPESVTYIGSDAFAYCSELETVNFNAVECADFYDYVNIYVVICN